MYIYPWFPPGRTCPDDQLPVREALYAAHAAADAGDDAGTIVHVKAATAAAEALVWYGLRDHLAEFVERFDVFRIAQYDTETQEAARAWVTEHHGPSAGRTQAYARLVAEACAQIHLANTGRWRP